MITGVLSIAGMLALVAAIVLFACGRASRPTWCALLTLSNGLSLCSMLLLGNSVIAALNSATLALTLWLWWNSGGGDGTRRRLRSWRRRFEGVRRTAPVASS
ncbi:hypothetical protein ACPXCH_04555 [Streptomyces albogriseolus]|uniref:hypothetical protein n=1 Tax=Streptomyces albogriseolus TaxID=1887 RepID=UPI003CEF169E